MLKKPFRYLSRVIFIAAIFCLLLQACTTIPTKLKNVPITSPGQVLTNSSSPTKLSDSLNNSCRHSHGSIVNPITTVSSPSGYGLDEFYTFPSDQMINMGTSCYFGSESQCKLIIDMMEKWAKANAAQVRSSSYKNSKYWNDTLTVNLRVVRPFIGAYSIARNVINSSTETDDLIRHWMHRTVKRASHLLRSEVYDFGGASGTRKAAHNHAIASSAAWMAYGAMWGDSGAFEHGIEQWFITLRSMRKDGSFPIETRRGARALFYTGRTLSALMSIAEMAKTQGIDLYAHSPTEKKTIHKAVEFMLDALEDNDLVIKYARENYCPGPYKNYRYQDLGSSGSTFGWIYPYVARFPQHPNSVRIKELPYWGGMLCGEWIGTCSSCLYYSE